MIGRLFGFTSWHGERGVLSQIGDKVQCHICGHCFHHLGCHVVRSHELTADQYCDEFGLNRTTGLISPKLAEKRRALVVTNILKPEVRQKAAINFQQSQRGRRSSPLSLEGRRNRNVDAGKKALEAGRATQAKLRAAGKLKHTGWPKTATTKAHEVLRKLQKDPNWKEKWTNNISKSRFKERICPICNTPHKPSKGRRGKICSEECFKTHQLRQVQVMNNKPDQREKIRQAALKRKISRNEKGQIITWTKTIK